MTMDVEETCFVQSPIAFCATVRYDSSCADDSLRRAPSGAKGQAAPQQSLLVQYLVWCAAVSGPSWISMGPHSGWHAQGSKVQGWH